MINVLRFVLFIYILFSCAPKDRPANIPHVLDDRLLLTLFAQDPDIVTPIGIAIDSLDHIFVLESHTHLPPDNYQGPKEDRIKIFLDKDGDGSPDQISIFAAGIKEGLNIAFSPEGILYVVTSQSVLALYDHDADGISDEKRVILKLEEPASVYAHAALLGITFSPDGWMYVSRGNTSSAKWRLVGTDGSFCSGYGDGGNIVRARPDGTELEEIATGFWNPVDIKFDEQGFLFAADNDPDSRGPNRLVHVVRNGDYGYKSIYGGSGIHPYLTWNGELPGTLPYAVGLGEAPSGLMNTNLAALPSDYKDQMLATIWEESRIVSIRLLPAGVSATGSTKVIIEGDSNFRPVAFATDSKGTIYFTDWVLRDYPNHGRGKIWRLSVKPGIDNLQPKIPYATNTRADFLSDVPQNDFEIIKRDLKSADPFVQHFAINQLQQPENIKKTVDATSDENADVRLGAAIALQRFNFTPATSIVKRLLSDSDERIRVRALIWIGQSGITELLPEIDKALLVGSPSPFMFEVYLETVRHLSFEFIEGHTKQTSRYAKSLPRKLPDGFLEAVIKNKSYPVAFRALAVRYMEDPSKHLDLLQSLVTNRNDEAIQLEAIRSLSMLPGVEAQALMNLAVDLQNSEMIRCEALLSMSRQSIDFSRQAVALLSDENSNVAIEAARYLRSRQLNEEIRSAMKTKLDIEDRLGNEALQEQLVLALNGNQSMKPNEFELDVGGDPARGRRVLFSTQSMCSECHAVEGRGGDLGPDLSQVAKSKTRDQLIYSILEPGEEVSPEYQGWFIKLKNGSELQGRQIDIGDKNIELYTHAMGNMNFKKDSIETYGMITGSLMPKGLEKNLTLSDLYDLCAFLEAVAINQDMQ